MGECNRGAPERNAFVRQVTNTSGCTYADSLYPDPYLAHVHHAIPPCGSAGANNIGLDGRDLTYQNEKEIYKIAILGGSVATQFGLDPRNDIGRIYFEEVLNRCYLPPAGSEHFSLWTGADGAWRHPHQPIYALLYGNQFDAIISLEGYNERYAYEGPRRRFETPPPGFFVASPLINKTRRRLVVGYAIAHITNLPLLRNSQVIALGVKSLAFTS